MNRAPTQTMLPPVSKQLIAHVDMNSYFASVEQQANPFLRGKPLGVCSYLHEYGCVIAASIEAKRLGMKVGMSIQKARLAVPGAVFVQNDPAKYRAVTSRVFGLFHELSDRVEHYSIDEAFLHLTGWYRDPAEAAWALIKVRRRIRDEIGELLRCSVGIAPTRFLAKTASDMKKPNGLTVIDHGNLDAMLSRLDLEDVCGIGPRTRKRLERLGIRTLIDIKRYPVGNLMRAFGKSGLYLWCRLHGMEFERVTMPEEKLPQSIGHSYCVPARVHREGKIPSTLMRLTERAGRRLRHLGLQAGSISVVVGFRGEGFASPSGPFWQPLADEGGSSSLSFGDRVEDSFALLHGSLELLHQVWSGQPLNFLAVTLHDLALPNAQTRLDGARGDFFLSRDRRRRVSLAVDAVRDKYGDTSIVFGDMVRLEDEAPDRIGFRKTEGVDIANIR